MSLYTDKTAIMNVIGCIFKNSDYLANEEYVLNIEDFDEQVPKIIYGALNNLYCDGVKKFDLVILDNYISKIEGVYPIFQNSGMDYIKHCLDISLLDNFDYYFERMKKFTLLRTMDNYGINVKWFYNPTLPVMQVKDFEKQEDRLNSTSLVDIGIAIDKYIEEIKLKCVVSDDKVGIQAGNGLLELLERLKQTPEIGIPLYGRYVNKLVKGARLSKLYLRSAATGVGKSRTMVADACMFACNEIFDINTNKWIENGTQEPSLYITTEQEIDEIQTMLAAFVANVDEEKILEGTASFDELSRMARAVEIIQESPLYIVSCPNFSLEDIESIIKINIKKYDVKYVCYDYIHTSMKILEEITRRSGGVKLREDNILFMLSVALKDLCNKYQIFIMTSTQLNGDWQDAKEVNQNLLRGAKAMADKVDVGYIIMPVREFEIDSIAPICQQLQCSVPTLALHFYKNRRSKYKGVILWCQNNLESCRINPLFMTDTQYKYIEIEDIDIKVKK